MALIYVSDGSGCFGESVNNGFLRIPKTNQFCRLKFNDLAKVTIINIDDSDEYVSKRRLQPVRIPGIADLRLLIIIVPKCVPWPLRIPDPDIRGSDLRSQRSKQQKTRKLR